MADPPAGRPSTEQELVAALRAAGCVYAEDEGHLLQEAALEGGDLGLMLARRVAGEPLEQVLGWAEFAGLRIRVSPGVFVPRTRTEAVARLGIALLANRERPVAVDLCCGSGAIGAALRAAVPSLELHAADLDQDAVSCARLNLSTDQVHQGDLYDALPQQLQGRIDVLAVNAPYVPAAEIALLPTEARNHEHLIALDGGPDGLDLHRRVAASAPTWLAPGGTLLIETSRDQAARTLAACTAAALVGSVEHDDRLGSTLVSARRASEE